MVANTFIYFAQFEMNTDNKNQQTTKKECREINLDA